MCDLLTFSYCFPKMSDFQNVMNKYITLVDLCILWNKH